MNALMNQRTIRTHVCSQCFGELVERFIDWEFTVVCPRACQPAGFVSRESAFRRKSESLADLYDVYHAYPKLRPATAGSAADLFQKEF